MARKKLPPKGPNNAYLLSFGDTMTTLLAFFIVLNSLAEDQTGANLHTGTGSFSRAMNSFGLAGNMPGEHGRLVVKHSAPAPDYVVPDPEGRDPEQAATGPDDNSNQLRVIDRDVDDFERFMSEMSRLSDVQSQAKTKGEAVFDYFNAIGKQAPILTAAYQEAMGDYLPLLHRAGYRIQVIVWATSPSKSAWSRAAKQAHAVGLEMAQMGNLAASQQANLICTARPWIDPDAQRPVLSVVVQRTSR